MASTPDVRAAPLLPAPPRAPAQWTPDYANQLNRWLTNLEQTLQGIYLLRGAGLYLSTDSLPVSGYGLYPGTVFSNEGVLTIVRPDDIWAGSLAVETGLGSVTVTIS